MTTLVLFALVTLVIRIQGRKFVVLACHFRRLICSSPVAIISCKKSLMPSWQWITNFRKYHISCKAVPQFKRMYPNFVSWDIENIFHPVMFNDSSSWNRKLMSLLEILNVFFLLALSISACSSVFPVNSFVASSSLPTMNSTSSELYWAWINQFYFLFSFKVIPFRTFLLTAPRDRATALVS